MKIRKHVAEQPLCTGQMFAHVFIGVLGLHVVHLFIVLTISLLSVSVWRKETGLRRSSGESLHRIHD